MELAKYWYKKSAKDGNICSQNNLGIIYAKGIGASQSIQKAAYWFRRAAIDMHRKLAITNACVLQTHSKREFVHGYVHYMLAKYVSADKNSHPKKINAAQQADAEKMSAYYLQDCWSKHADFFNALLQNEIQMQHSEVEFI